MLNAENIEAELGEMFRTMYKLGKVFADQAIPRNAADRVRRSMDKFKLHQPLLNVICNPGIRDRHWVEVPLVCYALIARNFFEVVSHVTFHVTSSFCR